LGQTRITASSPSFARDRPESAFAAGGAQKYVVDRAAPTTPLQRLKAQIEAYRVDDVER